MSTKFTIVLAIAAGFLGGLVSRNVVPGPVYAKEQPPPPNQTTLSLKEIRTHQFVLVDANGKPRGVFGFEKNGEPVIQTEDGGYIYSPRGFPQMRVFGIPRKPRSGETLLSRLSQQP